jgi:hypothetical protein
MMHGSLALERIALLRELSLERERGKGGWMIVDAI